MNILKIAKKDFKQNIRDIKSMVIMTLMPLIIILIMGIALSGVFNGSELAMSDVHVEYLVKGEKGALAAGYENLMGEMIKAPNSFSLAEDKEQSIKRIKNGDISCMVEIDEENKTILFYKNNIYNTGASIVEGVLNNYVNRFNVVRMIISVNPKLFENAKLENNNYITLKGLDKEDSPGSMDYYGVAMCILFVLYGIPIPATSIINEKKKGTIARTLISPVGKIELLLGKTLGAIGVITIQIGLVILATLLIFNVNWGNNPVYPFVLIFTQIIMAVSIGTALGILFDSDAKAMGLIHGVIVIFALFGGSYMPLAGLGLFGEIGKLFSPVWWTNNGIFKMIYSGEMGTFYIAAALNLGIAVLFLLTACWKVTKKEGMLNG